MWENLQIRMSLVNMNCVDKMTKVTAAESEMEEGEIVDELDDLSDISSEEEFLLRQRLEVLENYNNVLERKKAKRSSVGSGSKPKPKRDVLCDLSEISATELEDPHSHITYKQIKVQRHVKSHNKQKRRKDVQQKVNENNIRKNKDHQRKKGSRSKKRLGVKVLSQSSDESEDEYRNKRKKLADAVVLHQGKNDKSSLSDRLHKMIHGSELHLYPEDEAEGEYRNKRKKIGDAVVVHRSKNDKSSLGDRVHKRIHESEIHLYPLHKDMDIIITNNLNRHTEDKTLSPISSLNADDSILGVDVPDNVSKEKNKIVYEAIELSTDDDVQIISIESQKKVEPYETIEVEEEAVKECEARLDKDSDEDLELLRQHALESKPAKTKASEPDKIENKILSEDEDSDTTELRLICLKSALLKKAIEMKRKQKLQKKLSQSSNLEDDVFNDQDLIPIKQDSNNNTDTESVDMDMGSDIEDKLKDLNGETDKSNNTELIARLHDSDKNTDLINRAINTLNNASKEDELDDDEDLLRAKLLTSLSKNLTDLVNPEIKNTINQNKKVDNPETFNKPVRLPEAKKFIIKLDESDSEGEHEATENLTKMHIKLAEQVDFQQKLDLFLKSTRMEVEKTKLPHVQQPTLVKKPDKFVAKAVNHLPKSEQIEYKNLVRRMAELEKMKQTRQATINLLNQPMSTKVTLKPRNVTIENHVAINNNLEELIAKSRKTIAEESSKMLKLKEEATKLSQRYKIAATELRNISTAITLNKKQQRTIQNNLSKIRSQHQSLLKSSTTSLHSKVNGRIPHLSLPSNKTLSYKLQKENNPKEEYKNPLVQKTLKVSVINDFVDEATINNPKMSVQLDVTNNTKVVKIPNSEEPVPDKIVEVNHNIETEEVKKLEEQQLRISGNNNDPSIPVDKSEEQSSTGADLVAVCDRGNKRYYISVDDYKSPLDALGATNWQADPNAILCPFEVGGQCKDPDCKYLHTPTPEQ